MRHTKWNRALVKAKLCSEEWSRLCRPPVLKLPLTELSHICTTSDTALLQPHFTHVFSPECTVLQALFLLPLTEDPFISLRHIVMAADSCCLFLVWCPYAQHFQRCVAVFAVQAENYHLYPLTWPVMPHTAYFLEITYFLEPSVLCKVYPTCHRARIHLLLPQDILATLEAFILSDLFHDVLRTPESLMTIWEKKPSSAPCTYVGFLLCGTQVQLDVLQPLIFFNQKKEGGWGRRIWACFHACSNS